MHTFLNTPVGVLKLTVQDDKLTGIEFVQKILSKKNQSNENKKSFEKIIQQLNQYFKNSAFLFDLPFQLNVTPFQKKVLSAMQKIPSGETKTYGELALELKTSARAIGQACRKNPISIVIPCHRVTAKNNLGGFAGKKSGRLLDIKKYLLMHENVK